MNTLAADSLDRVCEYHPNQVLEPGQDGCGGEVADTYDAYIGGRVACIDVYACGAEREREPVHHDAACAAGDCKC